MYVQSLKKSDVSGEFVAVAVAVVIRQETAEQRVIGGQACVC